MNELGIRVLREIDLSRGSGHRHQDLEIGPMYLVLYNGNWCLGTFGEQWFGLTFCPTFGHTAYQFDTPGSNGVTSGWERVIEVELAPSMQLQSYTGYKPKENEKQFCECCGQSVCEE